MTGKQIDESKLATGPSAERAPLSGYQRVYGGNHTLGAVQTMTITVDCPPGELAISGGTWTDFFEGETAWAYVVDTDSYAAAAFWNTSIATRQVGGHMVCVDG